MSSKEAATATNDNDTQSHGCDCLFAPFARTRSFQLQLTANFMAEANTRICWPALKLFPKFA